MVPMPTPALAAMSRTGALTPDSTNAAAAASSSAPSFRLASARFRGTAPGLSPSATARSPPSRDLQSGTMFRIVLSGTMFRFSRMPDPAGPRQAARALPAHTARHILSAAPHGAHHAARSPAQLRNHDRPDAGRLRGHPAGL